MDEANAALDFLDGLTERSGNFVLALCAIGVIVALARGWLYGRRYVELVTELWNKAEAKNERLENELKGHSE